MIHIMAERALREAASRVVEQGERFARSRSATTTGFLAPSARRAAMDALARHADADAVCAPAWGERRRLIVGHPPAVARTREDDVVRAVRLEFGGARGSSRQELSHRQVLGGVLGLGIDRGACGDIVLDEGGAVVVLADEVGDFVCDYIADVGRRRVVDAQRIDLEDAAAASRLARAQLTRGLKWRRRGIASTRADAIVAACFAVSRSEAQSAIRKGLVAVDHVAMDKPHEDILLLLEGEEEVEGLGWDHRKGEEREGGEEGEGEGPATVPVSLRGRGRVLVQRIAPGDAAGDGGGSKRRGRKGRKGEASKGGGGGGGGGVTLTFAPLV